MNRIYYILPILFFCSFTISVKGQNDLTKKIEENTRLEKSIEALVKDSARLSQNIAQLRSNMSNDSLMLNRLKGELFELQAAVDKKAIAKLEKEIDSLKQISQDLDKSIDSLGVDINKVNKDIRMAEDANKTRGEYRKIELKEQEKKQKEYLDIKIKKYISLAYSQMHLDSLQALHQALSKYSVQDKSESTKLKATIANKTIYDKGVKCINEGGISNDDIVTIRKQLIALLDIKADDAGSDKYKLNAQHFTEIDSLDIKLSRMNSGVKALQGIVDAVNADETIQACRKSKGMASSHDYTARVEALTTKKSNREAFEKYFEKIPYLKNLLDAYRKELMNPRTILPTPTEQKIKQLKVK